MFGPDSDLIVSKSFNVGLRQSFSQVPTVEHTSTLFLNHCIAYSRYARRKYPEKRILHRENLQYWITADPSLM